MEVFQVQSIGDFEKYEYVQYFEEQGGNQFSRQRRTDLRIKMTDRDLYSFPADSFLHIRYLINHRDTIAGNDQSLFAEHRVAPVNGGYSMFRRAQYLLSNEIAEDVLRPGFVSQVKNLVELNDDYQRGQGKLMMYSPDKEDGGVAGRITATIAGLGDVHFDVGLSIGPLHNFQIPAQTKEGITLGAGNVELVDDTAITGLFCDGRPISIVRQLGDGGAANTLGFVNDLLINQVTAATYPKLIDSATIGAGGNVKFFVDEYELKFKVSTNVGILVGAGANGNLQLSDGVTYQADVNSVSALPLEGVSNLGFEERRERALVSTGRTSNAITMWLPVRKLFPILEYNPMLMRGIEQEIVLDIDDVKQFLLRSYGTPPCEIDIQQMSWWVPIVKPSLEVDNAYMKMLQQNTPIRMDWVSHNHYRSTALTTESEGNWLIKTTEHRPERVFVFFSPTSSIGNQEKNPYKFENYGVSRIFLRSNSDRQFPNKEYRINWTEGNGQDYMRVYSAYLKACGLQHSEQCTPAISYEEFKDLYPLYVFDLRAQDEQVWENTTQAHLTVEYTINGAEITRLGAYYINAIIETNRKLELRGVNGRMSRVQ